MRARSAIGNHRRLYNRRRFRAPRSTRFQPQSSGSALRGSGLYAVARRKRHQRIRRSLHDIRKRAGLVESTETLIALDDVVDERQVILRHVPHDVTWHAHHNQAVGDYGAGR